MGWSPEADCLINEKRARPSSISAPGVGSFDILFLTGQEAVCAVAIEASPPIPRPQSRAPRLFFPSRLSLTADLRPPCVASRRGERAPRVQDGRRVRVDGGGRVCGAARPRVGRARAQRRRWLDARVCGCRRQSAAADPYLCTPTSFYLLSASTTPSARAADASPAGARAPRASLAPLAASAQRVVDAYVAAWAVSEWCCCALCTCLYVLFRALFAWIECV